MNNDEWDIKNWTSRHYDNADTPSGSTTSSLAAIENDLFNDHHPSLDGRKETNDGGKMDEDGMFLSLQVLPGNSYMVERTGNEAVGYVTKIIYKTDKKEQVDDNNNNAHSIINTTDNANNNMAKRKEKAKRKREKAKLKKMERCCKATKIVAAAAASTSKGDRNITSSSLTQVQDESINNTMTTTTTNKERRRMKRDAKKLLLVKPLLQDKRQEQQQQQQHDEVEKMTKRQKTNNESSTPSTKYLRQNHNNDDDINDVGVNNEVEQLRTSWSIAAPGISLHPILSKGLYQLTYTYPTPIQSATLPPAILGRRDIVGAAPTGSGKTLSYGLPILQRLLEERDDYNHKQQQEKVVPNTTSKDLNNNNNKHVLRALILVPTRELAIQVEAELLKVCLKSIGIRTIVGGFAEAKQRRVLEKERPAIVVATPGRLWELMSSKDYDHLNDLTQLSFLVVDEADRMIKQGSFPQLQQIFEVINTANPPPPEDDDENNDDEEEEEDDDDHTRLKGIAGVRGEAKVVMLDDSILAAIERQRNGGGSRIDDNNTNADIMMHGKADPAAPMEMNDEEYERQMKQLEHDDSDDGSSDDEEIEQVVYHHRQTFVYSATLTLPPSMHHLIKKNHVAKMKMKIKNKKGGKNKQPTTVDGAIAEILEIAGARGETKVVDLTNAGGSTKKNKKNVKKSDDEQKGKSNKTSSVKEVDNDGPTSLLNRLPPGLTLGEIRCAQRHKDSHLYAYLVTTRQGSSGPCLVFCNSIAAVRRVGETLKTLGLPVKMLHAQMQQKSRLGALESLRTSNSRSIVVASDVAARGLDIQAVTTVVHYDVARSVDTFIHRAGRTARGVGEKAVGTSVSLVAPAEEREHQKICESVQGASSRSLDQVSIDGRLLNEAQERVALATKIVSCNDVESQAVRKNKWLQDAAKDAGLDVDEDMIEGGLLGGDQRDRQRFIDANRAKTELRQLLAKPMRIQHFGKFLSGVGLRESIKSEGEVKPFVVHQSATKTKHRQRKGSNK